MGLNTENVTSLLVNLSMHVVWHLIVLTIVLEHVTTDHDLQHVPNVSYVSWKVTAIVVCVLQHPQVGAGAQSSFLEDFLLFFTA